MKRHTYQNLFEEKVINNSSLCLSIPNTSLHSKFLVSTCLSHTHLYAPTQTGKALNLLIRSLHIFVQKLFSGILLQLR